MQFICPSISRIARDFKKVSWVHIKECCDIIWQCVSKGKGCIIIIYRTNVPEHKQQVRISAWFFLRVLLGHRPWSVRQTNTFFLVVCCKSQSKTEGGKSMSKVLTLQSSHKFPLYSLRGSTSILEVKLQLTTTFPFVYIQCRILWIQF